MEKINQLKKGEQKTFNKFMKVLNELKEKTDKINTDEIKYFYINEHNEELINSIPQNTEVLIIDYFDAEKYGKVANLPITLKKIIIKDIWTEPTKETSYQKHLSALDEVENNVKIPFNTEICLFNEELHFSDYDSDTGFLKFVIHSHKIPMKSIYTNIKHGDCIYFGKVGIKESGIYDPSRRYSTCIYFTPNKQFTYVFDNIDYIKKLQEKLI